MIGIDSAFAALAASAPTPVGGLSAPHEQAVSFSWNSALASKEFISAMAGALFGALAAFLLGVWGSWRQLVAQRRAAANMAILALGEMYSLLKLAHDVLITGTAARVHDLGIDRPPHYFEYQPLINMPSKAFSLDPLSLSFLVDSHAPDILNRLLAAEGIFRALMLSIEKHLELHSEFQKRMARIDPTGQALIPIATMEQQIGKDLVLQLKAVILALLADIPRAMSDMLAASKQLRDVLLLHFPMGTFIRFVPSDPGLISGTPVVAVKPALWRRVLRRVRVLIDKCFGPKWPADPETKTPP